MLERLAEHFQIWAALKKTAVMVRTIRAFRWQARRETVPEIARAKSQRGWLCAREKLSRIHSPAMSSMTRQWFLPDEETSSIFQAPSSSRTNS